MRHGHVEDLLGELDHALDLRGAAGQHDPGGDQVLVAAAAQLRLHEREQLVVARLDDLGERLPRQLTRGGDRRRRHLDGLVGAGELRERAGVLDLDLFGMLRRRAQRHGDVVGDLIAGDRDDRGVADGALGEHRDVRRAAADVDHADAEVLLVVGQHRVGGGQLLEDQVLDLETAALHALLDVLGRVHRAGHQVHLAFQAHAGHAERLRTPS